MERTYINEAQKAIGGTVKVQGFIENLRNSKYMAFIVLKDITGKLQITVERKITPIWWIPSISSPRIPSSPSPARWWRTTTSRWAAWR